MPFTVKLIKYHAIEMDREVEVWIHAFLTSALDGDE
jgi:hypothetical protein